MNIFHIIFKNSRYTSALISIFSIIVGMTYIIELYGETEAMIGNWGLRSVSIGILLFAITNVEYNNISRIILIFIIVFILMLQVPPISLWFVFGVPEFLLTSNVIAHWSFTLPHMMIFILCIINILQIKNNVIPKKISK